jgi:ribonuclease HI
MEIYVDGGCRDNGKPGSYGAAAACFKFRSGRWEDWIRQIEKYESPTNQRAEIMAITSALNKALEKYDDLNSYPRLKVTIHSDSQYAIGCLTKWIYKWSQNGWINAAGNPVVNQDLIKEASELNDRLADLGTVQYNHVPRAENKHADQVCKDVMDNMLEDAKVIKAYGGTEVGSGDAYRT